jgi:hypothetical protein
MLINRYTLLEPCQVKVLMTCPQPLLSFCAIVKNESANLGRCLASVKPYVDELIIVDTGSTDDIVAIIPISGTTPSA